MRITPLVLLLQLRVLPGTIETSLRFQKNWIHRGPVRSLLRDLICKGAVAGSESSGLLNRQPYRLETCMLR